MKLDFLVYADEHTEPLAAFQYREWAEEWRDKMCATGLILDAKSIMTMAEFLKDTKIAPPMKDADETVLRPNGGILGEP